MSTSVKHLTWLPYLTNAAPAACTTPAETAKAELANGLANLKNAPAVSLLVDAAMGESWQITKNGDAYTITGGESGIIVLDKTGTITESIRGIRRHQ